MKDFQKDAGRQTQLLPIQLYRKVKPLIKNRWTSAFGEKNGDEKNDDYQHTRDSIHCPQSCGSRQPSFACGLKAHLKGIAIAASALCDSGEEGHPLPQSCGSRQPSFACGLKAHLKGIAIATAASALCYYEEEDPTTQHVFPQPTESPDAARGRHTTAGEAIGHCCRPA